MSYFKKYGTRYNFDRVMPDHRYIPDVHAKDRIPFATKNYFNAAKYAVIFGFKKHPQIALGFGVPILLIGGWLVAVEYAQPLKIKTDKRDLYKDYRFAAESHKKELGAWNSLFECFQNDEWCGKDQE